MGCSIGPGTVAVVEGDGRHMEFDAYANRLRMVVAQLRTGAIGAGIFRGPTAYGCRAHRYALRLVAAKALAELRAIDRMMAVGDLWDEGGDDGVKKRTK